MASVLNFHHHQCLTVNRFMQSICKLNTLDVVSPYVDCETFFNHVLLICSSLKACSWLHWWRCGIHKQCLSLTDGLMLKFDLVKPIRMISCTQVQSSKWKGCCEALHSALVSLSEYSTLLQEPLEATKTFCFIIDWTRCLREWWAKMWLI